MWAKDGLIPASTFKIPHSLIALELGIIDDKNTLLKWNGEKRMLKSWQQDLTFKQAFHYSCVPCYQEIVKKIGVKRMKEHINKFNYGNMDIHADNIDNFWLVGASKINQFEQINFLKRLHLSQLPISKRTEQIFKQMFKQIFIAKQTNNYTLRAKSGLSKQNSNYNGWYIGYLEKEDNVYFFATNINPKENHEKSFNNKRKSITISALKQLGIIQ
ncbi:MAG: class D beta-lactamase [Proteobacteria bacterium]|nr:class D beta-lactamase [Pseudomonadota bacterium]